MNEDELGEEEYMGFGLRRGGSDKLTFRQVLYNVIMLYIRSYGRISSRWAVEKLIKIVYINEPGFKLREEIEKIKADLSIEKNEKLSKHKNKLGREYFKRANQAKTRLWIDRWYWDTLFEQVWQCLADHNLVIESEKLTKIRIKKQVEESEGDEYIDSKRRFKPDY